MMAWVKRAATAVRTAVEERPWALSVLVALTAAAMVLLLVWFLVFSGMNEPVQFVYSSF